MSRQVSGSPLAATLPANPSPTLRRPFLASNVKPQRQDGYGDYGRELVRHFDPTRP